MTRTRLALGAAVVVAAGSGAVLAASADPPYTKRLQILESLAVRYPGREASMGYLIGAKQGLSAPTLLRLLWRAHTTAVVYGLRSQRQELDRVRTTTLERNFWGSWIEIVFLLAAAQFPTDAATSVRASKLLMPPCSPLGTPGCRLSVADLGRTFPFVSALALRPASIDRGLREYAILRSNPAALAALELADPSLGLALRLYLAVAR